jgi:S-disulfanyl-L-cysteine oxidoreductase SoxD
MIMRTLILLLFSAQIVHSQSEPPLRTVLDGVYSDAQATRGKDFYTAVCSACHGNALEGVSAPALTGTRFIERWREGMLEPIYDFIRERMPFGRPANAKPIPDNEYLDMLTYILKVNGYPSGANELTPRLLEGVMFVGKNGPQPVPDGALVVVAGCLSEAREDVWILSSATEPVRSRTLSESEKRPGNLTFRLADLEAVPEFEFAAHRGQRVQAKGYLVRQPNAERISLTAIEMLDPRCEP